MYEILIGDKRNNVIRKLKESWMAKMMFTGCCWYLYDMFGRGYGLHMEVIILIPVLGMLLLNLLYVPFRLLGEHTVGHKIKLLFIIVADMVALYFFNVAEKISIAGIWKNFIAGVIISLSVTGMIVALGKKLTVHSQNRNGYSGKYPFDTMNGLEFENWSGEWLRRHGFYNIKVTRGSGDYGADVLCEKAGVTYAVQCKLYSRKVPYRAVEEVICAREYYKCDRAMIFTNSELTA